MRNNNNDELPREHQGQEQIGSRMQHQGGQEPPYLFGVGPINTIPEIEDDSNKKGTYHQQEGEQVAPALFGEDQFEGGLGPVYATPTVPWAHGQGQGGNQWQQWGGHPKGIVPCCMCCQASHGHYR